MPAVNASFFRMSATRKAFRNVRSTSLVLEHLAGPACRLDLVAGGGLARARALAAADALAVLARACRGLQRVETDARSTRLGRVRRGWIALVSHRGPLRDGARSGSGRARWGGRRARSCGRSCRARACAGSPAAVGFR